jgi:hypothetical protein
MWTILISLLALVKVAAGMTFRDVLTIAVSTALYNSLDEISKFAAIAYCTTVTAPFTCNVYCSDFPSTTLIQVHLC